MQCKPRAMRPNATSQRGRARRRKRPATQQAPIALGARAFGRGRCRAGQPPDQPCSAWDGLAAWDTTTRCTARGADPAAGERGQEGARAARGSRNANTNTPTRSPPAPTHRNRKHITPHHHQGFEEEEEINHCRPVTDRRRHAHPGLPAHPTVRYAALPARPNPGLSFPVPVPEFRHVFELFMW